MKQVDLANIPGLFAPQREFLIYNSSPDPIEMMFDGEVFQVPAVDKTVVPLSHAPDKFSSGTDSDGNLIPGSLLIRDKIENRNANADLLGNSARGDRWDAAAAIRHCLGLDPGKKTASGKFWDKGISLLPVTPTPDLVEAAKVAGQARWLDFQAEDDRELLNSYRERAAKHRSLGLQPAPPPEGYFSAEIRQAARLKAGLIKEQPAEGPKTPSKADIAKELMEDPGFMAAIKEKVLTEQKAETNKGKHA